MRRKFCSQDDPLQHAEHDRMGVTLKPKDYQRRLEEGEEHQLPFDLLRPFAEEEMKAWRVSDEVGDT